jgi:hypothetical protein
VANRIKLAGTTSTSFQIGLQKVTLDTSQVSSPYTLNLPSGTGTVNQILKTDGSGNLSWTTEYSYTLPTASSSTLGGVKVDNSTITINGSGVIQANYSTTLAGLTDVTVGTPTDSQVLTYSTASNKWIPTTVTVLLLQLLVLPTTVTSTIQVHKQHLVPQQRMLLISTAALATVLV